VLPDNSVALGADPDPPRPVCKTVHITPAMDARIANGVWTFGGPLA
jgi:hypothetical protein